MHAGSSNSKAQRHQLAAAARLAACLPAQTLQLYVSLLLGAVPREDAQQQRPGGGVAPAAEMLTWRSAS